MTRTHVARSAPVALALTVACLAAVAPGCQCGFDAGKLDAIACATEADCAPGQDCVEGTCSRRDCAEASDCGDEVAFECIEGRCSAVSCADGAPCPDRFTCADGLCVPNDDRRCTLHADCDDRIWCNGDERCEDGTCEAGAPEDCGLDLAPCEEAACDEVSRTCTAVPADDGAPCEDGDPCTGPDTCRAQVCVGAGDACDDGLPCTPGDCIPDVGCVVDAGACAIDGACWAAGDGNPDDPCLACDPAADPRAWSPGPRLACDDGDDCTSGDTCVAGTCAGQPYACDDEQACTGDRCDGRGGCTADIAPGTCRIDGTCRAAGEPDPANPCQACDPAVRSDAWSPAAAGVPADDGIACTTGSCVGGRAVHTPDDAACGGGQVCAPCAGGCTTPPSLTVDCPAGTNAPGGAAVTCTISGSDAAACLSCTPLLGMTSLVRNDFDNCQGLEQLGWNVDGEPPFCDFGVERLEYDNTGRTTLERTIDTSDFDSVRLCLRTLDVGMGANDTISIELSTAGAWAEVWSHAGGPYPDADWVSTTYCIDLVALAPAAADNPSLGVRVVTNLSFAAMSIDDLAIDAWDSSTLVAPGRVASSDFAACDLDGWVEGGDGYACPGTVGANAGADILEGHEVDAELTRTFDLSDRCDDVRVGLSSAVRGGFWPRDHTALRWDRGLGEHLLWDGAADNRNDDVFLASEFVLSHRDPEVRFQPAVTLRFETTAGGGATQSLDDLWVDGASCLPSADVTLGAIAGNGGQSTVSVTSPVQGTVHLSCTWDGRASTTAHDPVVFRN